jgi:Bacterial Ig-like domain (group 1)
MKPCNQESRKGLHQRASVRYAAAAALLTLSLCASAAPIPVPNGNFTVVANNGTIGGGLIGGSNTAVLVGGGPWRGTYAGIAALLAPPTLTIGAGRATVGGLAGVNVLGIVDNSGEFVQDLGVAAAPNRHYVMQADIDAGAALDLGVLNTGNAGLGISAGPVSLGTTLDTTPGAVSLSLLSATTYHVVLCHDTGPSVSGNLSLHLFAHPRNLVTVDLLTSASFSNVSLTSSVINPVASSIGAGGGTPQGATVNTAFAVPLSVTVTDSEGDPVANATVTFSAPGTGASAALSATTATTDSSGRAQTTAIANGTAGAYAVTASVSGVATPASFALTNLSGIVNSIASTLGTPQSATVNTSFLVPLTVIVLDAGNQPLAGLSVTFSAPATGPSATFETGASVLTNLLGVAAINVVANTVAGTYPVTAHINGTNAFATFNLTNVGGVPSIALPISGTPQSAMISTTFGTPLGVQITDAFGNASRGITVTFSAPAIGAGATFPPSANVTTIVTDANGNAQVQALANSTTGTYQVTATSTGLPTSAVYKLTNSPVSPPQGVPTSGDEQGTNVNAEFQCMLQLKVTSDGTTPMAGVSIDFVAPGSGPSSTLTDGITNGTTVTTTTDANGMTGVSATANSISGTYSVSAGVTGSGSALSSYQLTNFAAGERLFADGFESSPAVCPTSP